MSAQENKSSNSINSARSRELPFATNSPPSSMKKARSVDFSRLLWAVKKQQGGEEAHLKINNKKASRRSFSEGLDAAMNVPSSPPDCCTADDDGSDTWKPHSHHRRRRSASWGDSCVSGIGIDVQQNQTSGNSNALSSSLSSFFYHYIPSSTWTVGKVSLMFLTVATLLDVATYQVRSLESPELYDALSPDVIRPAFSYHSNSGNSHRTAGLGSAAISSVTEALSPILPFAGGVDLRREDYWTSLSSHPLETLRALSTQIHEAFASQEPQSSGSSVAAPEGSATSTTGKNARANNNRNSPRKLVHAATISSSNPFVKLDAIADLTLGEMAQTFHYVSESSKEGFREGRFLNSLSSPRLQKVLLAMKDAAAKSRGPSFMETSVDADAAASAAGSFDVLKFCAAMRAFAEWRILRNTPEGYKGFAMGMSLGHKDIVQNLVKIEQAAHAWMDRSAEVSVLAGNDKEQVQLVLRAPTLRELLESEVDDNVHAKLPYLKEKSAAMGLLWVRRQLHYHTQLLDNAMQVPGPQYANVKDAVSAAYAQVYDRYHGWAVQKIFTYSFQSAPEETVIFRHMNPHRLKEAYQAGRKQIGNQSASSIISSSNDHNAAHTRGGAQQQQHAVECEQDDNPFVSFFKHVGCEWDSFTKHVGSEWDKLISNIFKKNDDMNNINASVRGGASSLTEQQQKQDALEDFVTRAMVKDAHEQIETYLHVISPILNELAVVFHEFNMDDPTRV